MEKEDQEDVFDSDMDDEDLEDELQLPELLSNISRDEKINLLKFKRSHNEVSLSKYSY